MNSGCIGTGGIEQGSLKGEQGRGSYVAIGGGEHTGTVLTLSFPPLHHLLPPCFPQPSSWCTCPSPAVAVPFGPGLTVGDL